MMFLTTSYIAENYRKIPEMIYDVIVEYQFPVSQNRLWDTLGHRYWYQNDPYHLLSSLLITRGLCDGSMSPESPVRNSPMHNFFSSKFLFLGSLWVIIDNDVITIQSTFRYSYPSENIQFTWFHLDRNSSVKCLIWKIKEVDPKRTMVEKIPR